MLHVSFRLLTGKHIKLMYIICFSGWETLPYPPAHGEFAVYTIDDLVSGVDFAVSRVSLMGFFLFQSMVQNSCASNVSPESNLINTCTLL